MNAEHQTARLAQRIRREFREDDYVVTYPVQVGDHGEPTGRISVRTGDDEFIRGLLEHHAVIERQKYGVEVEYSIDVGKRTLGISGITERPIEDDDEAFPTAER